LDPTTGAEHWTWTSRPGVGVGTAFVASDDIVVVPTTPYLGNPQNVEPPADASQLIGLDRRTGSVRWAIPVPDGTFSDQFRTVDGVVAFTASDAQGDAVRAGIDVGTGTVLWTAPGTSTTELRVVGGMLFASPYTGGQDRLVRLDPATGAALLPTGVEHSIRGLVAVQQDWLVGVATRTDAVAAVDAEGTGTLMWMDPTTGAVTVAATLRDAVQQLIPVDDAVIVLAADDALFCD
jgi:outer membrane protein assembly factor BamB